MSVSERCVCHLDLIALAAPPLPRLTREGPLCQDRSKFYVAKLSVLHEGALATELSTIYDELPYQFNVQDKMPWQDGIARTSPFVVPDARRLSRLSEPDSIANASLHVSPTCTSCVTVSADSSDRTVSVDMQWTFVWFPFDRQTIDLEIKVPFHDVVATCARMAADPNVLDKRKWEQYVSQFDIIDVQVVPGPPPILDTCVVTITVQRNVIVFMVNSLLAITLIVFGALLTLHINPTIPPLFGGRCAGLISSMIVVMLRKSVAKETLGSLTYVLRVPFAHLSQPPCVCPQFLRGAGSSLAPRIDRPMLESVSARREPCILPPPRVHLIPSRPPCRLIPNQLPGLDGLLRPLSICHHHTRPRMLVENTPAAARRQQ